MKTALVTLALVAVLAPSFANAGSPIDVTHRAGPIHVADPVAGSLDDAHYGSSDPVANSLNGAHYDMPQLHSDAIDDAVLGKSKTTNINVVAKLGPVLKCTVAGTPSEFPNDLLVANIGLEPLPAGTKLAWKADSEKGSIGLLKALQPGKTVRLSNVLAVGVEAGSACTARAIGL